MANDANRFIEELEDCGGDIGLWHERKERENSSFWGFELDPQKVIRLITVKELCRKLHELDKHITFVDMPLENSNRHGSAQIVLPYVYFAHRDVAAVLSRLYAESDNVFLSCPYCAYDEEIDEDEEPGEKKILMTFCVEDMWQTYGKRPF